MVYTNNINLTEVFVNPKTITLAKFNAIYGDVPDMDYIDLTKQLYPDDLYLIEDFVNDRQKQEERFFLIGNLNRFIREQGYTYPSSRRLMKGA